MMPVTNFPLHCRKPHSFKEEASFKEIAQRISLQDALAQSRPDLLKKFQERSR